MTMQIFTLTREWKETAIKAWSVRFMILAMLVQGIEMALPFFGVAFGFSELLMGTLTLVFSMAALYSRFVYQSNMWGQEHLPPVGEPR